MSLNFDFSPLIIALISAYAVSVLAIVLIYCPFVRRVARRRRECELTVDRSEKTDAESPAVSVIVYSQGEAQRLEQFLPIVLRQDYTARFEVIVVNEGDSEEVRNAVSAMQMANRNLYLTFTPDGARNLSRKKLALTLGIKAARFEVVVLTTVDAIIFSDHWLTKMVRHFRNQRTGIVLGYAAPYASDKSRMLDRVMSFNCAAESVNWLSAAIGNRPFRGTELNLAYRRELFFANKGFSRSLNLHFGDDDIFISEIATRDNTVVELSPESIVRYESYDNAKTIRNTAVRHLFTGRYIKSKPLSRLALGETAMWSAIATGAVAVAMDYLNIVTVVSVSVLMAASVADIAYSWRKATVALEMRRLTLTAPVFALMRPFHRLLLRLYARISKQKKFTWD